MSRRSGEGKFDKLVALKYQLYNGLFLTLPFASLGEVGIKLPVFTERCSQALARGESPETIVKAFFRDIFVGEDPALELRVLFLFAQLVERQVVLFDALEEAAFSETHGEGQGGSLGFLLERCEKGAPRERLREVLKDYCTRVVLTAHPTQFYPEPVLGIIQDLARELQNNSISDVEQLLLQMGKTSFRNPEAPTPLSEAQHLLGRTHEIFYEAMLELEALLEEEGPSDGLVSANLELGFWPGGDRDGNPNVDVATTRQVARELRACAMEHYRRELGGLRRRLTFSGMREALDRIEACLEAPASEEQLLEEIQALIQQVEKEHQGLFVESARRLHRAVRVFGWHFASLDLRQDSSVVDQVMAKWFEKLPGAPCWEELSSHDRVQRLKGVDLEAVGLGGVEFSPVEKDLLDCLASIEDIQAENGPRGLQRFIISNTQGPEHVLAIHRLAYSLSKRALPFDIVPLFETVDDLQNSEAVMRTLFSCPVYKDHLEGRGKRQTVMLGFSDGTKDGGYLTCNWEIAQAKTRLDRVGQELGIQLIFFDGRGGPPARGGGNTHRFYRAVGDSLRQAQVQLTLQGQTISSNYGSVGAAKHNLEQLFTAGLEPLVFPEERVELSAEDRELLGSLSKKSHEAYLQLRQHPAFLAFLEEMTPLRFFGTLNVASRPAKRKADGGLSLSNLRAIPFVGSWSQVGLNVPGFYGFGTALEWVFSQGKAAAIQTLYREKRFFRTLVDNSMQALQKANADLTRYLLEDPEFGDLIQLIHSELARTRKYILQVSQDEVLLAKDPINRKSIHIREQLMLPVQLIQQYVLDKLRKGKDEGHREAYEKLLLKTVPAIVNASRNSA